MQIFKFLGSTIMSLAVCFHVYAQNDDAQNRRAVVRSERYAEDLNLDEKRKLWTDMNLTTKQDAVDFIKTTYKDFTIFTTKRSMETGIYKREVKFNDCELIIETEAREQESSWKADRDFTKNIVVIDLDKVILDGDNIKPSSPENAKGLFQGRSYSSFHKIPSYSILTAAPNRDNDIDKFNNLHYEQHLQWAYQFLIERCSTQK